MSKVEAECSASGVDYPRWKSASFLFAENTLERFGYYGVRAVLILFLRDMLAYSDDDATLWYHVITTLSYIWPLGFAIAADSGFGKTKAIAFGLVVYVIGMCMTATGGMPQVFGSGFNEETGEKDDDWWQNNLVAIRGVSLGGLMLVTFGNGIKSCVSPHGGDQFEPSATSTISTYFAMFYFSTNVGAFVTQFLTPLLRDQDCGMSEYDLGSCFQLALWVPAAILLGAALVFFCGTCFYYNKPPAGNVIVKAGGAIRTAIKEKRKVKKTDRDPNAHWLDYAIPKYGKRFCTELRYIFPILVMFIPCPFFWALFDLTGSRWTLSATQLNGQISENFTLLPDQIQALNPIMVLLLIPTFNYIIYPLLAKCNLLTQPLQKMSCGMFISASAFLVSGVLQLAVEQGLTATPNYYSDTSVVFVNGDCEKLEISGFDMVWNDDFSDIELPVGSRTQTHDFILNIDDVTAALKDSSTFSVMCDGKPIQIEDIGQHIEEYEVNTFVIQQDEYYKFNSRYGKSSSNYVIFQVINPTTSYIDILGGETGNALRNSTRKVEPHKYNNADASITTYDGNNAMFDVDVVFYDSADNEQKRCPVSHPEGNEWGVASIWTIVVNDDCDKVELHQDSNAATISILTFIPQYFLITVGEIMVSVTGVEWAYTEAPPSMKAIMNACWVLTTCIGNLIDLVIVSLKFTREQSNEYFIFAGLMTGAAIAFLLLAIFYYDYVPDGAYDNLDDDVEVKEKKKDNEVIETKADENDEEEAEL